jgi:hypothetical protein
LQNKQPDDEKRWFADVHRVAHQQQHADISHRPSQDLPNPAAIEGSDRDHVEEIDVDAEERGEQQDFGTGQRPGTHTQQRCDRTQKGTTVPDIGFGCSIAHLGDENGSA